MFRIDKTFAKIKGNIPNAYIFTAVSSTLMYASMSKDLPVLEIFSKSTICFIGIFLFLRIFCAIFADDFADYENKKN